MVLLQRYVMLTCKDDLAALMRRTQADPEILATLGKAYYLASMFPH
jgi:hypothetical protein